MKNVEPRISRFDLRAARTIAHDAHQGQTRDGGQTYMTHVERVHDLTQWEYKAPYGYRKDASSREYIGALTVALLHDVVEDSDAWTLGRLEDYGCPEDVLMAVDAITKRPCTVCYGTGRRPRKRAEEGVYAVLYRELPFLSSSMRVHVLGELMELPGLSKPCSHCSGSGSEARMDYLERVKANPLAVVVKRCDAYDNMMDDGRKGMTERYRWVLEQLDDAVPILTPELRPYKVPR